jgi:pimeloyl-ACP methyl ester carboxylesterase
MLILTPLRRISLTTTLSRALTTQTALSSHNLLEKTLLSSDNLTLAFRHYESTSASVASHPPTIMLHGWLDNSATFDALVPRLHTTGDIYTLDFTGHGLSDHKRPDSVHLLPDYAFYVKQTYDHIMEERGLPLDTPVNIVGHSMGAGVGSIFAACYPALINKLVMIEGFGPLARPSTDVVKHVRSNIDKRAASNKSLYGEDAKSRLYETFEDAVAARVKTATLMPGKQYISHEAAAAIVSRGTRSPNASSSSVEFTHDKRLQWPSLIYFTLDHVITILSSITSPTLIIKAKDGWPVGTGDERTARMNALKHGEVVEVRGSHHCHADGDTVEETSDAINRFCFEELEDDLV